MNSMPQRYANAADPYKFAVETASLVRQGRWDAIDRKALLDELEKSIAGGIEQSLHTYVRDILRARLSMKAKIDRSRNEDLLRNALWGMNSLIRHNPSVRDLVTEEFVEEAYKEAKHIIGKSIRLPKRCPYSSAQLLKEAEEFDIAEL